MQVINTFKFVGDRELSSHVTGDTTNSLVLTRKERTGALGTVR
jgi:hypothetical protein